MWTHQLSSGALLLFAFFMISDPMTTPSHPKGRAVHAAMVAAIAYAWGFGLFRTNAVLWALFVAAPMVAVWDVLWPAPNFDWTAMQGSITREERSPKEGSVDKETSMVSMTSPIRPTLRQRLRHTAARSASLSLALGALLAAALILWPPAEARRVLRLLRGPADAQLYNHASQVVMVRDGDQAPCSA